NGPRLHQGHLVGAILAALARALDLEHDVARPPCRRSIGRDVGADGFVHVVGEGRSGAGAGFHHDPEPEGDEAAHDVWRGGDAILAGLNFLGNGDFHVWRVPRLALRTALTPAGTLSIPGR